MKPSTAVIMKFEEVLMMETWTVEVPRARALVKSVHIMPLKTRLRTKNICRRENVSLMDGDYG
jgi:hypothetical protein